MWAHVSRVLRVFLSRTAQRVPYITTRGVLRMLGVIVLTVSWFLCAWTVGVLQNRDRNVPLLIISTTSEGQGFNVCDLDRWDYMMAVGKLCHFWLVAVVHRFSWVSGREINWNWGTLVDQTNERMNGPG